MATIGIVNLTERLHNQTAGQAPEPQSPPSKADATTTGTTAATGDQFTPSAQNAAQAAGLFTVSQFTLFSPAAESLLAHAADPLDNPANSPAPAAHSTAAQGPQETAATNAAAPVQAHADTAATAGVAAPAPANASAKVEHQLQLLNNALTALGLNSVDIQKIDNIAGLIDDFHPTRFANLADQLQALAQQAGAKAAATADASAAGGNPADAAKPSAGPATEPGRQ